MATFALETSVQVVTDRVGSTLLVFWHQIVLALIDVGTLVGSVLHKTEFTLALEGSVGVDTLHTAEWVAGVETFNVALVNVLTDTAVGGVTLWTGAGSVGALSSDNLTDNIVAWVGDTVAIFIFLKTIFADASSLVCLWVDTTFFVGWAAVARFLSLVVSNTLGDDVTGLNFNGLSCLEVLIVVEATARLLADAVVSVLDCVVWTVAVVVTVGHCAVGCDWLEDGQTGWWFDWTAILVDSVAWAHCLGLARVDS